MTEPPAALESAPLLTLRQVTKSYGRQRVLSIERLDLFRSQTVFLHGRNGSGKSTLLRLLGGIAIPRHGSVKRAPLLRQAPLGFLPQSGGLYGDLTLRQNLQLRRRIYGLRDFPLTKLWYVEELDLERYLDRRVAELSGGFQRLAGLAATLYANPRWLLLDEPLNGVDAHGKGVLKRRFATLAKQLELCVVTAPSVEDDLGCERRIEVREGAIA
jgi:ABC-type multidrug transport system ATPase subunit